MSTIPKCAALYRVALYAMGITIKIHNNALVVLSSIAGDGQCVKRQNKRVLLWTTMQQSGIMQRSKTTNVVL